MYGIDQIKKGKKIIPCSASLPIILALFLTADKEEGGGKLEGERATGGIQRREGVSGRVEVG